MPATTPTARRHPQAQRKHAATTCVVVPHTTGGATWQHTPTVIWRDGEVQVLPCGHLFFLFVGCGWETQHLKTKTHTRILCMRTLRRSPAQSRLPLAVLWYLQSLRLECVFYNGVLLRRTGRHVPGRPAMKLRHHLLCKHFTKWSECLHMTVSDGVRACYVYFSVDGDLRYDRVWRYVNITLDRHSNGSKMFTQHTCTLSNTAAWGHSNHLVKCLHGTK